MIRHAKIVLKTLLVALLLSATILPFPGCGSAGGKDGLSGPAVYASKEYDTYAGKSGEKYWRWAGFNSRVEWCACFASWCADQAGLTEKGMAPKNASVINWISFYRDHPEAGTLESGDTYKPVSGDFIIWQRSEDPDASIISHIGVVERYDAETDTVYTIEGNSGDSIQKNSYKAGKGISFFCHPKEGGSSVSGCSSSLGGGDTINIPAGLGKVHSYMAWQLITSPSSAQYKLRSEAGQKFDSEGFGKIGDRYVIACTTTYGDVGDFIDFELADGSVIECVIGDIKSQGDPGCNEWGHLDGTCVIEFVVDKNTWYNNGHPNPGTETCHPEWNQTIPRAINRGSWFDGDTPSSSSATSALKGCTSKTQVTTKLGGTEGKLANALLEQGLAKRSVAAILGYYSASEGFETQAWDNATARTDALVSAYSSWNYKESFEDIEDTSAAAEYFARYFAHADEATCDWSAVRSAAENYQNRL